MAVRGYRVRISESGLVQGCCIAPVRALLDDPSGPYDPEEANPWVAYQMKLWVEARPDLFAAVANHSYRTDTVPPRHVRQMARHLGLFTPE